MEDMSEFFKRGLHKKESHHFGKNLTASVIRKKVKNYRRETRQNVTYDRRHIPADMSPICTPMSKIAPPPDVPPPNKRLEILAKWKEEKLRIKELELKKRKPIFKVSKVPIPVGLPNLDTVNTEIKGKPFKSKFAPENHRFHPPKNIKPIKLNSGAIKKTVRPVPESTTRVTRSQTRQKALENSSGCQKTHEGSKKDKKLVEPIKRTQKGRTTPKKSATSKKVQMECLVIESTKDNNTPNTNFTDKRIELSSRSPVSIDYLVVCTDSACSTMKTPEKEVAADLPMYISPFVTMSRGKDRARKEYHSRKEKGGFSPAAPDYTSPKAGAEYFSVLLKNQSIRIEEICRKWTSYKDEFNPPEEASAMINTAIGQSNLLITKKFVQFSGLIERCQTGTDELHITCEDLHGYWDVMYMQIQNIDKRFNELDELKGNNWQEIVPEVKKCAPKRKTRAKTAVKSSSTLKDAIKAGRLQKQALKDVTTPQKNATLDDATGCSSSVKRKSCLYAVRHSESKKRLSSPGLVMMRVSTLGKHFESGTPGRGILKTDSNKSIKKKSVIFRNDNENDENNVNIANQSHLEGSTEKVEVARRRSARLSRTELRFD